jgi:hypothetical protein
MTWYGYRDPHRRAMAVNGANPPPLPIMTEADALKQAKRLRDLGCSFPAISLVMGDYHGQWASKAAWRDRLERPGRRAR